MSRLPKGIKKSCEPDYMVVAGFDKNWNPEDYSKEFENFHDAVNRAKEMKKNHDHVLIRKTVSYEYFDNDDQPMLPGMEE